MPTWVRSVMNGKNAAQPRYGMTIYVQPATGRLNLFK
jgi:hypothetical protein